MVGLAENIKMWIKHPETIDQEAIAAINQGVAKYPWYSSLHLLLAKGYENVDSHLKAKSLKLAALYAGDRESLFSLMYNQQLVRIEEIDSGVEEKLSPEKLDEEQALPEQVVEEKSIDAESEKEKELKTQEDKKAKDDEKIDFDKAVKYDPLVDLIEKERKVESDRVELPFDFVAYDPEKELEKLATDKEEADNGEGKDFLFWLNNVKEDEPKPTVSDKSPDAMQNLLDQFLASKTTRPIRTREFYNPETKVERSETDNLEEVSETLVEIYIKQEYYDKAIEGLNKLSLLIPPKSAYFAARIKEIEQLQKDK